VLICGAGNVIGDPMLCFEGGTEKKWERNGLKNKGTGGEKQKVSE